MTVTRLQRNSETNELRQPSIGPSERKKLLETCQRHFSKELDDLEAKDWANFLSAMPIGLLRQAFEKWNRSNEYFPKIKHISDLVSQFKVKSTTKFQSCGDCQDGWVKIYNGKTEAGHDIDKFGAMVRCQCWSRWAGLIA